MSVMHNKTKTVEYLVWRRMLQATQDPTYNAYKYCGAKGITICPEWKSFIRFYTEMGDAPKNCNALKLLKNSTEYSKSNCEWTHRKRGRAKKSTEEINSSITVPIRMKRSIYELIKKIAVQESGVKKKNISAPEIVRNMLERYVSQIEQLDMFGNPRLEKLMGNRHV